MYNRLTVLGRIIGLLVLFGTQAFANHIDTAVAKVTCTSYSLTVSASELTPGTSYTINYQIVLTPPSGSPTTITGLISFTGLSSGTFSTTITKALGPLTANYTLSGTATLQGQNTISIAFSPGSIQCAPPPPLVVTCSAINTGTVGVPFNSPVMTVTGGTPPYTFSVGSGTLPAGLTLNTSTGAISGTPTTAGTFTIKVTDAKGAVGMGCTIIINPPPLVVTCSAINMGTVGVPFNSPVMTVTGGTPPYTFSVGSGTLPAGLTLNTSTGAISGTPTTTGTFTIRVTDAKGAVGTGCTITINPPPLVVTCSAINMGTTGVPFNSPVMTVTGGTPPYTFSVGSGTLPAGLILNTSTGAISGTPTAPGTFTIKVTDSKGAVGTGCSITINPGPPVVTCSAINTGTVGMPFNTPALTVTGGTSPYTFSVSSGTLPAGLTLNASTGAITGTPTAPGTFTIKVTDANGAVGTGCTIIINPSFVCMIPPSGTAIGGSPVSWNKFNTVGSNNVVWIHAHIGTPGGVSTTDVSTVQFTGVSFVLNGQTYALPDGLLTFDPAASATPTTTFDPTFFPNGRWRTTLNPNNLSDEIFFDGNALPVDSNISGGGKATFNYTTLSSDNSLRFNWQWSAAVYTFWPGNNAALILPYHNSLHAGTPQNPQVQHALTQGPRGGGGSNYTGSWSGTGNGACPGAH